MRRWLLALMTCLVAVQLSWAGAQLCCVQELTEQRTALQLKAGEPAHVGQAGEAHKVCETGHCHCHHAGCATPLDEAPGLPTSQAAPPEPGAAARLKSHVPSGLERPDWQRA